MIFTDSLSSLQALSCFQFHTASSYLLDLIRQKLHRAHCRNKFVTLAWVPSHVGIAGNEKADTLAKEAARRAPLPGVRIPSFDLFPLVRNHLTELWQRQWDGDPKGRKFREIKPSLGPWQSSSAGCRRDEVSLCRLRMGHTHSTHSYLLARDDPPECPRCGDRLTVKHVLLECPDFEIERNRHLPGSPTLDAMLGQHPSVDVTNIMQYLKSISFNIIYSPSLM